MVVNYQNGKVYKITGGGLTYIGSSTVSLSRRLAKHRDDLKNYNNAKREWKTTSFQVLEFPDCKITLIEDVPCERKEQLLQRERFYIETMECVNKVIPLRTKKEWVKDNAERVKEYNAKYDKEHPEIIKKSQNKYRLNNKDKILQRTKEYRLNNQDKIKQYDKANKERRNEYFKIYKKVNKDKVNKRRRELRKIKKEIKLNLEIKNV